MGRYCVYIWNMSPSFAAHSCAVSTTLLGIFLSLLCATIFVLVEIAILRRFWKGKQKRERPREDEEQVNDYYEPVERTQESGDANEGASTSSPITPAKKGARKPPGPAKLIAVKKNEAYEAHS